LGGEGMNIKDGYVKEPCREGNDFLGRRKIEK
jgi:hypothetical protein